MALRQPEPLSPPLSPDREILNDYSTVIQKNLEQLFELAHGHTVRTVAPTSNEGEIGDIVLVQTTTTFSIYAKFPSGWKSTLLT